MAPKLIFVQAPEMSYTGPKLGIKKTVYQNVNFQRHFKTSLNTRSDTGYVLFVHMKINNSFTYHT
jgi:hypothetical protein